MKKIQQGDIYLINLNPTKGHEQSGTRPVLIMQNDTVNSNLSTIIIAPITSNLKAKGFLTTHFISKTKSKLKQESVALLYQLRTIDKSRLIKKLGNIQTEEFQILKEKCFRVF